MFSSVHGCRFAFSQWSSKVTFAYSQCVSERAFGIIFPFCTANSNTDWINYSTVTYQEALSECKALKERRDRNYSWNSNEKGHSYSISFFIFISHPLSYIKVTQKLERAQENTILSAHFCDDCLGVDVGLSQAVADWPFPELGRTGWQ